MLASLLVPLDLAARGKDKDKSKNKNTRRKGKGKGKQRAHAEAEPCWRAGACIPATGSNVSRCDLAGSTAFNGLNCTGCNVSRANLRGIDARNANFTKANLSGSCLVDADFTGATFASTTNLSNAIFCNTTMPNGSINNPGCGSGTACCSTCTTETCGHGRICTDGVCSCPPQLPSSACRSLCGFQNMGTVEGCNICMADLPSCGQPDRYPPCNSSADCAADAACASSFVGCGGPGAIGVCVRVCSAA